MGISSRAGLSFALLLASTTLAGCLGTAYRVPHKALVELAGVPPEQRGQKVRVIQGFASSEGPPPAPAVDAHAVVIIDSGPIGPGPHRHPGPGVNPGYHHLRPDRASVKADEGKFWLVAMAAVAVGLAVTEGARYDGWVQLHPMHPVHLYGPRGEYTVVPLAQIDPATAAWASRAYVRETEGPWRTLRRAPLDRQGFTFGVLLGTGQLHQQDGDEVFGPSGHVQLGVFPVHQIGLLLDIGTAWSDNTLGDTVYDSRTAFELEVFPVQAGRLHAGLFGQIGGAYRLQDDTATDTESGLLGAGAILQLDLTTRLALTGRAGMVWANGSQDADFTVGLSVY